LSPHLRFDCLTHTYQNITASIGKKIMRLSATITLLMFFSLSCLAGEKNQPLRWGYVNFAPYHSSENGDVVGSIAEKIDLLFKKAEIQYTASELPNKRVKLYIEQGDIDITAVIESFISSPELFFRSNLPVYTIKLGAICLRDNLQINSLEQLKKLEIILMSGYTYGHDKLLNDQNGFNIALSAKNHESAIKALIRKRADCVLGYMSPINVEALKYTEDNLYFYPIGELPVYLYLNKTVPNAINIMKSINQNN